MAIDLDDIRAAAARIEGAVHRTPVFTSRTVDERTGATVFFKAESLQRTGSFKPRGAYNRISSIPDDVRARGVVAYSSGNHAQAVAYVASVLGITATIVMPDDAPPVKRAATEGYGAEVVSYDRQTDADRAAIADAIADERGATVVPPYDHPLIMAGQGTVALELIEEVGDLDLLVVCVGGGGLIAGCATATKALLPRARVVGIEPALADDHARSFAAGHRVRIDPPTTIADGLRSEAPGELTFEVNRHLLDGIDLVSEGEILAAMAFLADRMKLVVEPSGAVAPAAVLHGHLDVAGTRVGVVISGGNAGADRYGRYLQDASEL